MPVHCKNDPSNYDGLVHSPKGSPEYCAHCQDLGSKKIGIDGNQYQVRATKNGRKSWKLVTAVPDVHSAIIDAAVAGADADSKLSDAVSAVSGAAKAQDDATKAITTAVSIGGPDALDAIKEIQERLQTAEKAQIYDYLRAKKKQGVFNKPLKFKGYSLQDARADAIAIRQGYYGSLERTAMAAPKEIRLSQESINSISDEYIQHVTPAEKKAILPKMKKFLKNLRYEPGYVNSLGKKSGALKPGRRVTEDDLYAQALSKVAEILQSGGDFEEH